MLLITASESAPKSKTQTTPDIEDFIDRLLTSDKFEQIADKIAERAADKLVSLQSVSQKGTNKNDTGELETGKKEDLISVEDKKYLELKSKKTEMENKMKPRAITEHKTFKRKKKTTPKFNLISTEKKLDKRQRKKINSSDAIHRINGPSLKNLSLNFRNFATPKTTFIATTEARKVSENNDSLVIKNKAIDDSKEAETVSSIESTTLKKTTPTTITQSVEDEESEISSEIRTSTTKRKKKSKKNKKSTLEPNTTTAKKIHETSTTHEIRTTKRKKKAIHKTKKTTTPISTTTTEIKKSTTTNTVETTTQPETNKQTKNDFSGFSSESESASSDEISINSVNTTTSTIATLIIPSTTLQTLKPKDVKQNKVMSSSEDSSKTEESKEARTQSTGNYNTVTPKAKFFSSSEDNSFEADKISIADTEKDDSLNDDDEKRKSNIESNTNNNGNSSESTIDKINKLDFSHLVREQNGKYYAFAQDPDYEEYQDQIKELLKSARDKNPSKRANINQDLLDFMN